MSSGHETRLLDPRWQRIAHAGRLFYEQLEPYDVILGLNIVVLGADGQIMAYLLPADQDDLVRHLITDPEAVTRVMREAAIDVTPDGAA